MQVKVDMSFRDVLDYIFTLKNKGEDIEAEQVIRALETDVRNTETRMENAEKELLGRREPLACGSTPTECLYNFAEAQGWLEQGTPGVPEDNEPVFTLGEELGEGAEDLTWGYRFKAGGTSFKGAGIEVPGGYILTWCK